MGAALFLVNRGNDVGWQSPLIVSLAVTSVLLGILLWRVERKVSCPSITSIGDFTAVFFGITDTMAAAAKVGLGSTTAQKQKME